MIKNLVVSILFLVLVTTVSAGGSRDEGTEGKWRIAFSNDYAGNSWRQQMLKDWTYSVDKAIAMGLIEEGPSFTTNESSAADQAAQIQNLILEGYDVIVIEAASPTALNGAVKKAVDAGIPVISIDNTITEESAYRLITDFVSDGKSQIDFIADKLDGGNILEVRGMAGTSVNDAIHEGIMQGLAEHPEFTIVGEVYGNWTQSVAQKEVSGILPSLPEIGAVVTQGGDGYGTIKAFEAAGRPIPIVCMGNRYDELALWKELKDEYGYDTYSCCIAPSVAQIAFWTALEILNGSDVPKVMHLPPLTITNESLDYFLVNTEKGGVASVEYPRSWVRELIANVNAGNPAPADPIPTD